MVGINTNINALFANSSLTNNQVGQTKAMQQLSTGLRVNSARDDAAGLAISTSMNSSARGMATAIRNINDGISLAQIADSSLSSVTNNLQRVRELALQSANGILLDSNRSNMQIEVKQLINEIDNISSTTNFNNIKLFSGTTNKIGLQTNTSVGDIVNVKVPLMNSRTLGLGHRSAMMAQGFSSLNSQAGSLNKALSSGDLIINGVIIGSSISKDDNLSVSDNESSAIAKVASINKMADLTGVSARVGTTVASGVPMSVGASGKSGTLTINGVSTGIITLKGDLGADRGQAVKAINLISKQTGVHAVDMGSDNLGVQLIADDGRNITIYSKSLTTSSDFNAANLGVNGVSYSAGAQITNVGIFTGTYSLQSLNDEPIKISTQTTSNIANSGLAVGVYDTNESYINSLPRPSVSGDQNIPPIVTTTQGGTIAGVTEYSTVNFDQLGAADTLTIGGLTLTATAAMTATEVAAAFQSIVNGGSGTTTKGTFTGSLTGWKSDPSSGASVKFTSVTTNTNVTDLQLNYTFFASNPTLNRTTIGLNATTASPGIQENDTVSFKPLAAGSSFTLLGITASGPKTANDVALLFANQHVSGWSTGPVAGGVGVAFIKDTPNTQTNNVSNPTLPNQSGFYTVVGNVGGVAASVNAPATTEVDDIQFGNLSQGDQIYVGGLTLTANTNMTSSEVATAFSSINNGSNYSNVVVAAGKASLNGTLNGWSSSAATGSSVTWTSSSAGAVGTVPYSRTIGTGGKPSSIPHDIYGTQLTQGYPAVTSTETNIVQFGNLMPGTFVSVGGLTLTATVAMSVAEVTAVFQNLTDGASSSTINVAGNKGIITGSLNGWNTSPNGSNVLFTSTNPNTNVNDLSISYTQSTVPKGILAGDLKINGFDIPASIEADDKASITVAASSKKEASAISVAAAINKVSNLTDVYAVPKPNVIVGGNFTFNSTNNGTIYINSFPVRLNAVLAPLPAISVTGAPPSTIIVTPGQPPGSLATPEVDTLMFTGLNSGQSLTIAGITIAATSNMDGSDIQAIFDNLSDGSAGHSSLKATVTGSLTGWSSSNFGPNTLFTRSVPGPSLIHMPGAISTIPGTDAVLPVSGIQEVSNVSFGQLAAGDNITVAGITLTAQSFMTANEVAQVFSNLSNGSPGNANPKASLSGVLNGFDSAVLNGNAVQFTCTTAGPSIVNSISYNIAPPVRTSITKMSDVLATINSIANETGVFATDNGSGITLTAPDGRNISLATGTDPATNTLTLENIGLGPSPTATANQQYPALKINGGPEGAITTYSTVTLNSDKSFTMSGGAKDTSLADLSLLGFKENTYGGSNDGIKIAFVDISSIEGANDALAAVENAISQISNMRSDLGAIQNKLLSAIENLTSSGINNKQSISRISDTDYGLSTTELARSQIINQAATAMLAQANQQSQLVMQLLKNS